MDVVIREATTADLPGITEVAESCFPQDFDFGQGFDRDEAYRLFQGAITDSNEYVCVAVCADGVVGFAYYINKPPTNGTVILEMIGVKKSVQGQGIGITLITEADRMLEHYIRQVRGFRNLATINLSTSSDNPVGQRLYLKAGYRHVGNFPGFVGEGNTELLMLKTLGNVKYRDNLWAKEQQ